MVHIILWENVIVVYCIVVMLYTQYCIEFTQQQQSRYSICSDQTVARDRLLRIGEIGSFTFIFQINATNYVSEVPRKDINLLIITSI